MPGGLKHGGPHRSRGPYWPPVVCLPPGKPGETNQPEGSFLPLKPCGTLQPNGTWASTIELFPTLTAVPAGTPLLATASSPASGGPYAVINGASAMMTFTLPKMPFPWEIRITDPIGRHLASLYPRMASPCIPP
jgi:hypothetical protein